MDLLLQQCKADGADTDATVLVDSTNAGTLFALNTVGRLWSCDAQLVALGTEPHFLATRFVFKLPGSLAGAEVTFKSISAHPRGQYVIIEAVLVRLWHIPMLLCRLPS
jgi:hypothetical protein